MGNKLTKENMHERTTHAIVNAGDSGSGSAVASFNFSCNLMLKSSETRTAHSVKR